MKLFSKIDICTKPQISSILILALASSFLIASYEFVRSASTTLFKGSYGIENYPIATALIPIASIAIIWIYGKLLTKYGPQSTLSISIISSGLIIFCCYFFAIKGYKKSVGFLFIFKEAYIVFIIAQFWSFTNSILSELEAKKWNGIILAISTLGGIIGGLLVHQLAEKWGTHNMVLTSAILCIPCWLLSSLAYSFSGYEKTTEVKRLKTANKTPKETIGIQYFFDKPILTLIFSMVIFSQFFSFFAEYNFQISLGENLPDRDRQTSYSGLFFAIVNFCSVGIQIAILPILLQKISIKKIHIFIPLINIATIVIAILHPNIWTASFVYMVFKILDYSIFKAAKEILYIPLPFGARFRTKEIIDVFGYRFGKSFASLSTELIQRSFTALSINKLFLCLAFALAWLISAKKIKSPKKQSPINNQHKKPRQ